MSTSDLMTNMTEKEAQAVCTGAAVVAKSILPQDAGIVLIVITAAGEVRLVVDPKLKPEVVRDIGLRLMGYED